MTALSLFLVGLSCAIGQHVFYSMKHGTLAERQEWTIRIGTGLAYLLGFSMAALVGISRDQWVWRTLRTRFFPLRSIDALFGVTTNVFCFLDFTMVWHAKVSTLLAALKWLFPLVTIFTPSTISVVSMPFPSQFPCEVPTLSFFPTIQTSSNPATVHREGGHDLDYGRKPNDTGVNTNLGRRATRITSTPDFDYGAYADRTVFIGSQSVQIDTEVKSDDCYTSPEVLRYFRMSAYSGEVISPQLLDSNYVISEECSVNCTYSYRFVGPSISCTELKTIPPVLYNMYRNISEKNIVLFGAGQGSDLISRGRNASVASEDEEALYSHDRLWVFHSSANDTLQPRMDRSLHGYTCDFGHAQYSIAQNISDRFLQPVMTVDRIEKDNGPIGFHETAQCVLRQALREILGGYWITTYYNPLFVEQQLKNYTVTVPLASNRTNIRSTSLVDESGLGVRDSIGKAIEEMAYKMVVSLIADEGLKLVEKTNTTCKTTRLQNTYVYKPFVLVLVNTTAMFFSALVAVLGALALVQNGVASDSSFSTFLRTTRNPTLDRKLRGGSLGGSSFRKRFGHIELKYGELPAKKKGAYGDRVRHVGMGIKGEVNTMQKGRDYY